MVSEWNLGILPEVTLATFCSATIQCLKVCGKSRSAAGLTVLAFKNIRSGTSVAATKSGRHANHERACMTPNTTLPLSLPADLL